MQNSDHIMIAFEGVSKNYGHNPALRDVSFSIGKGEMSFLTGPSGAGKSTLLKLIYLAERPDQGIITLNGVEMNTVKESHRMCRVTCITRNYISITPIDSIIIARADAWNRYLIAV